MTHETYEGRINPSGRFQAGSGRLETLRVAGEEMAALLTRHEQERAVERERAEMLDRIDARTQARSDRALQGLRRDLYEADRRWRAKVGAMRSRAAVPSVPMCVPQPLPEVVHGPVERVGGWWDDPVAAEVIDMVDAAPLGSEEDVRRVRVSVARRLHPDLPGNEGYAPLVATINDLLDGSVERLRAGVADVVPGG